MSSRSGFLNVTILEAQNRAGGRIKSVPAYKNRNRPGHIEHGAQWIHGQVPLAKSRQYFIFYEKKIFLHGAPFKFPDFLDLYHISHIGYTN